MAMPWISSVENLMAAFSGAVISSPAVYQVSETKMGFQEFKTMERNNGPMKLRLKF
jgi:hypothetical protein